MRERICAAFKARGIPTIRVDDGTLSGTTQAYTGTNFLGEPVPRLSVTLAREPLATH
jgi:hypothetical protein